MQLFFAPNCTEKTFFLTEEESRHCVQVLRKRINDEVFVTNGIDKMIKARIVNENKTACELEQIEVVQQLTPKPYKIHLVIAPTKNIARFEWMLEKLVEIGIDEITPILCKNSEKVHLRSDRLQKIILSALKQSLNIKLPHFNQPIKFADVLHTQAQQRFIAWCETSNTEHLHTLVKPAHDVLILIGPEGDFAHEEITLALANGFTSVSLGEQRLRTETAGLVATQIIHFVNL